MFCPNCGTGDQNPKAYCKRCGQWLLDPKSARSHTAQTAEKRMNVIVVFSALSGAFGLLSALVLFATYLGTPQAKWSVYLAGAFGFVIAVYQAISFAYALELRERLKRRRLPSEQAAVGEGSGVASLGAADTSEFINVQSVTENATERLDPVPLAKHGNSPQS
jgi:hypothetical protein